MNAAAHTAEPRFHTMVTTDGRTLTSTVDWSQTGDRALTEHVAQREFNGGTDTVAWDLLCNRMGVTDAFNAVRAETRVLANEYEDQGGKVQDRGYGWQVA